MELHNETNLENCRNAVITIGSFDGLHIGHRTIFQQVIDEASSLQAASVVISFEPHPRTVIQPNALVQNLTTADEKISLFRSIGIHHLVIYPFTTAFANFTAEEYVEKFIIEQFHPKVIIIGYDHHFGKHRSGNIQLLQQYADKGFFKLIQIQEQTIQEIGVSSTKIRNALLYGEIEKANALLGYSYFFSGTVVMGKQLGRTIGFKTANIHIDNNQKLIPGNGVYVVTVALHKKRLQGMMNIGTRPTVDGTHRTIEVHIVDFDEDIYGETLEINILTRLRNEQKFDGLDALKAQLNKDKTNTIDFFKSASN
jgi:riboflavin kinase / FMN adenylyltransferase